MNIKTGSVFRYKVGYRRNGKNYFRDEWNSNLILDTGLNKVASVMWQNCWTYCLFGNQVAPNPVQKSSGAVTFSVSGTTCTASGNFFVSGDSGALIKFDDANGQEFYLTYVNATTATLSATPSPAISGEAGKIWYVNQTQLQSLYSNTSTYQQNVGDNSTTAAGNVITYKRTSLGPAVAGPVTLTEIGFNDGNTNTNIFDRDIITGGLALLTGDQPLAIGELIISIFPNTVQALGNVATGYDSSGDFILTGLNYNNTNGAISFINPNGTIGGNGNNLAMEPSTIGNSGAAIITANFALGSFSNGPGPSVTGIDNNSRSLATYTNGNFYRDRTVNYNVSTGNGTIYGLVLGAPTIGVGQLKFTTPFTKLSTQTLSFTLRISWQRILTN